MESIVALVLPAPVVDPPPTPEPTPSATPAPISEPPTLGMLDLVLRDQSHLTRVLLDERALPAAVQKLLVLSLLGLGVHGFVVGLAAQILHPELPWGGPLGHPVAWMPLSLVLAFTGGLCVCLPSFYFYTQLAGLDASFRLVTGQALRAQATTAVLLLGVAPFYAALVLGCVVGAIDNAPAVVLAGLVIPFVVGLYGMRALHRGFGELAAVLPLTHRRRGDFLRRMVVCWTAVYAAVTPVALVRLAQTLAHHV
jgi:hypothetical protein